MCICVLIPSMHMCICVSINDLSINCLSHTTTQRNEKNHKRRETRIPNNESAGRKKQLCLLYANQNNTPYAVRCSANYCYKKKIGQWTCDGSFNILSPDISRHEIIGHAHKTREKFILIHASTWLMSQEI